jgi:hypothetical protein
MMFSPEDLANRKASYQQALNEARQELETRMREFTWISQRIQWLKATIGTLEQLASGQQQTAFSAFVTDLIGVDPSKGLTENCRRILVAKAGEFVRPMEVREFLRAANVDLSRYPNQMAMIHTTLKRLVAQGEAIEVTDPNTGGMAYQSTRQPGSPWPT